MFTFTFEDIGRMVAVCQAPLTDADCLAWIKAVMANDRRAAAHGLPAVTIVVVDRECMPGPEWLRRLCEIHQWMFAAPHAYALVTKGGLISLFPPRLRPGRSRPNLVLRTSPTFKAAREAIEAELGRFMPSLDRMYDEARRLQVILPKSA